MLIRTSIDICDMSLISWNINFLQHFPLFIPWRPLCHQTWGGWTGANCQGRIHHCWPPLPVLMASLGAGKKACWRITDLPEVISVNVLPQMSAAATRNHLKEPQWPLIISGQGPLCITGLSRWKIQLKIHLLRRKLIPEKICERNIFHNGCKFWALGLSIFLNLDAFFSEGYS